MGKINSSQKGKRAEREICKILKEALDEDFSRVYGSGALGHSNIIPKEALKFLSGDINCANHDFIFSIENKNGYDVDIINLMKKDSSTDKKTITDFCRQSCEDAKRISDIPENKEKIPLVIYKKDRREPIIIIPAENHFREKDLCLNINTLDNYMSVCLDIEGFPQFKYWNVLSLKEVLEKFPKEFFFRNQE